VIHPTPNPRRPLRRRRARVAWLIVATLALPAIGIATSAQSGGPPGFTNFETEPVRPLALAPGGNRLFAVNTADDRLEVLAPAPDGLARAGEVAVGLRPVAVAARTADEVWVVNHLSDSVSIVDASDPAAPRVVRTLAVGDEPRDIVVAGPGRDRVFVAAARRSPTVAPGEGQAAVWVFDARRPEAPPAVIPLFGTKPRGLAVTADGARVFAGIFRSGNRTTTIDERTVATVRAAPEPTPTPGGDFPPPPIGLILRRDGQRWLDAHGNDWQAAVPFRLPDDDVWIIDAASATVSGSVAGVGTVIFNLAARPGGEVWVTNTEARNTDRFESGVRGRAVQSRVTRLVPTARGGGYTVQPIELNAHLEGLPPDAPADPSLGLSQPADIVFGAGGDRAYVAVFGSRRVAVLDGEGRVVDRLPVGFGPGGLALDEGAGRLYVLNHLDASISVIDIASRETLQTVQLRFDPTPAEIKAGRPMLYDAESSSAHGDQSCASCHVFADLDALAWDLGVPGGEVLRMPFELTHDNFILKPRDFRFHPEKGPMMTQSLRGLAGTGPLHWRGDRFAPEDEPASDLGNFMRFRPAFVDLLGRAEPVAGADMEDFGRFVMTIRYPPNPNQNPDRSLTPDQAAGAAFFGGDFPSDSGVTNCAGCHTLPLGTNGLINFEGDRSGQDFKAPHFRNLYEKGGRLNQRTDAISGYGFSHDGSIESVLAVVETELFNFPGEGPGRRNTLLRRQVEAYLMAFDTGMAPAVGRQLTVAGAPAPGAGDRALATLLMSRAAAGDCDLVARGRAGGVEAGWLWRGRPGAEGFAPDRAEAPVASLDDLFTLSSGPRGAITFTCVPPGDGRRGALDRDRDGFLNGDEVAAGSDPADPRSYPGHVGPPPTMGPVRGRAYLPAVVRRYP